MPDDKTVSGSHHFKLELGGPEGALLFQSASMGGASLSIPKFKTEDANGNPINSLGGGTSVTWQDLSIVRGVDTDHKLWEWFTEIKEKGVTPETKKEIKLIALDSKGETLHTWNFVGAVISSYQMSGSDAQSEAILTEQVSIQFEDATLEPG
jgi:phage tail-like protein